jgi:agmatine deiminase
VEFLKAGEGSRRRARDVATLRRAAAAGKLDRVVGFDGCHGQRRTRRQRPLFAGTYLNLFITRKAVLTARFGDRKQDLGAERQLRELFPNREIRMLEIDTILNGGGGIRCLTQPVPA